MSLQCKGMVKINSSKEKALLTINQNSLRQYFIDRKLKLEKVKVIDLI